MNKDTNIHAVKFAERVCGIVTPYRGLHLVTYNYGSSPSLAYWTEQQERCTQNLHFLNADIRDKHIVELLRRHTSHVLFRAVQRIKKRLRSAAAAMMA